ncbi:class I ribonucleotide reductase maintenance protein YfaE [Aliamphritea spongicola]|uniref:class I ribonucleotide reductase maintenance protein YfaE n=1 Tax=Aliamphritea spongicola TaxID=707589 RepID=UPI00196B554F|nr:class I ribonucleotide reductase maintenance protein YfaE [Aliamphritea spongicola]MBN3563356.1 2Fe-2S iron-sulfur cluster binding domain-containing protein [Aliamphritea spongicola]
MSGIPRIKVNHHGTFYYQYEFSLLDALEAQEIPAPYNCRGGYCGTCKVRLIDGEVEQVQDALFDTVGDEILTCCCKPVGHIEIEIPED